MKLLVLIMLLLPGAASAAQADSLSTDTVKATPWEFSLAGYYYAFPETEDLVMAVARANHGALHLEGRYNYEARRTASLFVGRNFSFGEGLSVEATPMAGVAFGDVQGIIPALELSLGYRALDFYAEGEYLFDLKDNSGNFAYTWLELAVTPVDLIRTGFVAQRLRPSEMSLEVDRGVFAQLKPRFGIVSLYYFNPFSDSWILTLGFELDW
jgi:hypothetical protein